MQKKYLKFVPKTIWIIIGLLVPTAGSLSSYYYWYVNRSIRFSTVARFAIYYLPAILLIIVFACVSLFIWKKPYSLFALSFGFLITPASHFATLFFIGGRHWFNVSSGFGGFQFKAVVMGGLFSVPLAVISFLPTIPAIVKWYRRKNSLANKAVNTTESEDSNESVK
jgi:hypothetical protein